MWAICERLGRADEAARYLKVARRCWAKAEPYLFNRLQAEFAKKAATLSRSNVVAGE
jgi:hypothetical protein